MKKYTRTVFANRKEFEVVIPVPTPKEFQATFEVNNAYGREICLMITNLSNSRREKYAVCMFEPETSEILKRMGFKWQVKARDLNTIRDIENREDAIAVAIEFISGRLGS